VVERGGVCVGAARWCVRKRKRERERERESERERERCAEVV
jgi:hypothetical protein